MGSLREGQRLRLRPGLLFPPDGGLLDSTRNRRSFEGLQPVGEVQAVARFGGHRDPDVLTRDTRRRGRGEGSLGRGIDTSTWSPQSGPEDCFSSSCKEPDAWGKSAVGDVSKSTYSRQGDASPATASRGEGASSTTSPRREGSSFSSSPDCWCRRPFLSLP